MTEEFLSDVENGKEYVYSEETAHPSVMVMLPLIIGGLLVFIHLILMIATFDVLLALLLVILVSFIMIKGRNNIRFHTKTTADVFQYGVRGFSRRQLSNAIHFLDMIQQGYADTGKIVGIPRPNEHIHETGMTFGSTIHVLKAVDKETAHFWTSTLQEKLQSCIPTGTKYFLRITIYGTIIDVFMVAGLVILSMFGLIDATTLLLLFMVLITILGVFVGSLRIYALRSSRGDPPAEIIAVLEDSQIRYQTERALEMVIDVIKTEGNHLLRILVLGDHEGLHYTNRTYRTTRDLELKAAVLIPDSMMKIDTL